MKINHIVLLLIVLLNVSIIANIYFLTLPEPPKKWCRDEVFSWEENANGDFVMKNYLDEEINKFTWARSFGIEEVIKFDDSGMGFRLKLDTEEKVYYKVTKAWDISTAYKVEQSK